MRIRSYHALGYFNVHRLHLSDKVIGPERQALRRRVTAQIVDHGITQIAVNETAVNVCRGMGMHRFSSFSWRG